MNPCLPMTLGDIFVMIIIYLRSTTSMIRKSKVDELCASHITITRHLIFMILCKNFAIKTMKSFNVKHDSILHTNVLLFALKLNMQKLSKLAYKVLKKHELLVMAQEENRQVEL